jgi:hypothetical protein
LPPSIPDPKFAYGFEEDDTGKLVPQQPPARDDSLGPAFYNALPTTVCSFVVFLYVQKNNV